jgi:hypothetical protein
MFPNDRANPSSGKELLTASRELDNAANHYEQGGRQKR